MANKRSERSAKTQRAQDMLKAQQRRERMRNLGVVGAIAVAVAIIGVVLYVVGPGKDTTGKTAHEVPSGLTGDYAVTIGKASAPTTIKLYEDLQCPICAEFEKATGAQVAAAVAAGKVKIEYHMVAFLDQMSSTNYSSRALNAAAAVLDTAGKDDFYKYHSLLYENQPAENSAGLTDDQLIQYAVQAGADQSKVAPLINDNAFHQWVLNATDQMSKDNVSGTPTVYINGKLEGPSPQDAATAVLAAVK